MLRTFRVKVHLSHNSCTHRILMKLCYRRALESDSEGSKSLSLEPLAKLSIRPCIIVWIYDEFLLLFRLGILAASHRAWRRRGISQSAMRQFDRRALFVWPYRTYGRAFGCPKICTRNDRTFPPSRKEGKSAGVFQFISGLLTITWALIDSVSACGAKNNSAEFIPFRRLPYSWSVFYPIFRFPCDRFPGFAR